MTAGSRQPRRLVELAGSVSGALSLDAALAEVAAAVAAYRPDSACVIRLVDADARGYRLAASDGVSVYPLPPLVPFGQGLVHVVAETRKPLFVRRAGTDPRVPAHAREGLGRLPVFYGVPIEAGDDLVGILVMLCPDDAPPGPDDREVVALLVGLAAVAITKARLFAESEARRRAAEALADVSRVLARALDLPTVARRIVDSVDSLLGTRSAALFRLDPASAQLVDLAASGDVAAALGPALVMPAGTGISGLAVRERQVVVTTDLLNDPRIAFPPDFRRRLEKAHFRAAVGIPLLAGERVLGALVVADRVDRAFGEDDVRLAQSFADQAALALERAELFDEAQRGRRQAEVIADVARGLTAERDLATMLQRIVEGVRALCGSDAAGMALRELGSDIAVLRYAAGAAGESWRDLRIEPGKGLGGGVLATGRPARTAGYAGDPAVPADYLPSAVAEGIVAGMVVPIGGEDRVEGLLYALNRSPRPFTDQDEAVLKRLADHASIAIRSGRILAREQAARAEAEAGNRARDQFLAMLGHELRNPLSAIASAVSGLRRAGVGVEQAERLQAIIHRQTQHLSRLVDDLLDVSRLTSGKITLKRQRLDLKRVAEEGVASLAQADRTARHDVAVEGQPVVVEGDATRLEQVVWNLLDNALKYTPAGGRIRVTVGPEGDRAVLRVRDTGSGIAPDVLPGIFDLFVQATVALDRTEGGLGLGLTLVRRLVELHGGTVAAASAGPGQGSEFVVRLPRLSVAAPPAPAAARGPAGAPRRVLVIEDNRDVREGLRVLLELWGHQVNEARDGPAGIAQALASPPDVALIDIGLPGLDGYAVARRLRATPDAARSFLIALTGYGQPEDRRRAFEAGFDAHLVKPVDPGELTRVLAQAARDG